MSEKQDEDIPKKDEQILMFHDAEGNMDIPVKMLDETVWLTQEQMAQLFQKSISTINEHIRNIYKEEELNTNSTIRKIRIVQKEGNRDVQRVRLYSSAYLVPTR